MITLDLNGFEELKDKLNSLSTAEIRDCLTSSALLVSNEARINCPVDTGRLRSSITFQVNDDFATVGTNVDYAPYVHYGTGLFASAGDGRQDRWSYQTADGEWHSTLGQPPQPFLDNALNNNKQRIVDIFNNKIKEQMTK